MATEAAASMEVVATATMATTTIMGTVATATMDHRTLRTTTLEEMENTKI